MKANLIGKYMHAITITIKRVMNLSERREGYMQGFGRRKGKGEIL